MHIYHLLPLANDGSNSVILKDALCYPIAYFSHREGAFIAAERWLMCNRAFHPCAWYTITVSSQKSGYCVVFMEDGEPIGVLAQEVVADVERYSDILAAGR